MRRALCLVLLAYVCILKVSLLSAQEQREWHISPMQIRIQMGDTRLLQLLDDRANELTGGDWTVDEPNLARIERNEQGIVTLYPLAPGIVHVSASLRGIVKREEITIQPAGEKTPGVIWNVLPLGRGLENLPAVPTNDGPDLFFLEQDGEGTYVRGLQSDGIQRWLWTLPEATKQVALVCSDDLGGIVVAAVHSDSYTLYVVTDKGALRWRHTFTGIRKGHALNYDGLLHLLNQAPDGTWASIEAWDEETGVEKFSLRIPASHENELHLRRSGDNVICASDRSVANRLRILASGLFVNTDGDAYAAFTQNEWTVGVDKCVEGSVIAPQKIYFSRDDKLVLWRIHSDGSVQSRIIDQISQQRTSFAEPMAVFSPTGDIIPDGFGGVLLSVRSTHNQVPQKVRGATDEYVYRITENGNVAYRFPLPKYSGPLHDEMVLGDNNVGFATRGGMLIAFNVENGDEVWHWDSGVPEIKIYAATGGGGCVVDTPEGMVMVENGVKKKTIFPSGPK
jgi:outer membrane protein assembly factor BamB